MVSPSPITALGIWEGVDGSGIGTRAVLHIVHRHAVDVVRLGKRRADLHLFYGNAAAARRRLLKLLAVSAKRSIRPLMRSCGPYAEWLSPFSIRPRPCRLEHAEPEVVEIQKLHFASFCLRRPTHRVRPAGLNSRMKFHSGMSPTLVTLWMIGSRKFTTLGGSCGASCRR